MLATCTCTHIHIYAHIVLPYYHTYSYCASLVPRPHPQKESGDFGQFSWFGPSVGMCVDTGAFVQKFGSDWPARLHRGFKFE